MNDAERDAWLREALRHAPDADAVPPSGISEAILSKARAQARAGTPLRQRPARAAPSNAFAAFWDWLARPPVAASFASVMAATLVGLMWWDRPMDETMPRPPAMASERNDAGTPPASTAPAAVVVAPAPSPNVEATPAPPSPPNPAAKAAPDAGDLRRRQRDEGGASRQVEAEPSGSTLASEKRKWEPLAKERAIAAEAKNEAPAPFPAAPAEREAQAPRKSLDAPAALTAKKVDEARRSPATAAVERAAAPSAAAPASPPIAPPPAPFSESAQRQGALGELRDKDAGASARSAPAQAAAPPRNAPERARLAQDGLADSTPPVGGVSGADAGARADAKTAASPASSARPLAPAEATAQADAAPPAGAAAAAPSPLARVLAAIAADPQGGSRRTASGATVPLDAAWRAWLAELDAAASGRWRPLTAGDGSAANADAANDGATTLRVVSAGRLAAIVRVDAAAVQVDAAPGTGSDRWQATLTSAAAERLRTTSRRLVP